MNVRSSLQHSTTANNFVFIDNHMDAVQCTILLENRFNFQRQPPATKPTPSYSACELVATVTTLTVYPDHVYVLWWEQTGLTYSSVQLGLCEQSGGSPDMPFH